MPKRSGRKSAAQTPAPVSERIKGSAVNRPGSASSKKSASKIVLSKQIVETLKKKAKEFNEANPGKKVSVATLMAVFRRGAGAYSKSHRPTITGNRPNTRTAWSYARVNKFLDKKAGKKVKKAYVQDDDLLEHGGIAGDKITIREEKQDGKVVFVKFRIGNKAKANLSKTTYLEAVDLPGPLVIKGVRKLRGKEKSDYEKKLRHLEKIGVNDIMEEAWYFDVLEVSPKYRGQGIATRILNEVFDWCRMHGVDRLYLYASSFDIWDKTISQADLKGFYRRHGFVEVANNTMVKKFPKLKAPNGRLSNLRPEQYWLVRTPEFKAWFGDWENDPKNASKVIDENGEPLVLYHGSDWYQTKKFYKFKRDKIGSSTDMGSKDIAPLFYFTDSVLVALDYSGDDTENIIEVFLNIRRMKELTATPYADQKVEKEVKGLVGSYDGYLVRNTDDSLSSEGWDEQYVKTATGWDKGDFLSNIYMVYEPNDIKLADGSNKSFDPETEDIRYARGGVLGNFSKGGKIKKLVAPNGKPSNLTPEQYTLVRTPEFKEWFGDWENDPENASKVVDENGEPLIVYHGSSRQFNVFDKSKVGTFGSSGAKYIEPVFYFTDNYFVALTYTTHHDDKRFEKNDSWLAPELVRPFFLNIRKMPESKIRAWKPIKIEDPEVDRLFDIIRDLDERVDKITKQKYRGDWTRARDDKEVRRLSSESTRNYVIAQDLEGKSYTSNFDQLAKKIKGKADGAVIRNTKDTMFDDYEEGNLNDEYFKQLYEDRMKKPFSGGMTSDIYFLYEPSNIKLADGSNTTFDGENPDIRYADGGVVFVRNENYDTSMTKRRLPYRGVSAFAVRTEDFERFKQYAEREEGVDPSNWTVLIPTELGAYGSYAMSMEETNDYVMGLSDDKPELKPFDPEEHTMVIDQDGKLDYEDAHEIIIMPVRMVSGGMTAMLVNDALESAKLIDEIVEFALENDINPNELSANEFKTRVDPNDKYADFELRLARRELSGYFKKKPTGMSSGGQTDNMQITCQKCGWSWDTKDSSPDDAAVCHKCGHENPQTDVISMNTPTFLRAMEFAKEDAKTDMELHKVAENAARLSKEGPIEMGEYDQLVKLMAGGRLPDLTHDEVRLLRTIRRSGSLPRKFMDKEDISMANKLVAKGWLEKGTSGERPHSVMYYVDLNREDLDRLENYQLVGRIKKGDTVRIKNPYPDEDPNRDYLVVQESIEEFGEDDGIDVMALGTGFSFPPISRIRMGDLEVVGKSMAEGGETPSYNLTLFPPPQDGRLTAYQFSDPKEALMKAEELDIRSNGGKNYFLRDTFTGRVIADGPTLIEAIEGRKPLQGHDLNVDIFAYEPRQYEFKEFMDKERELSDAVIHCDLTRLGKAMVCQAKIDVAVSRGGSAENPDEMNAWQCVENHWRSCLRDCQEGPCVTYKRGGETWDCGCGKTYRKGGLAYGNSHDKGGIPLTVSSTGQDIEIEGGEGVVNKRSMQIRKTYNFEGKRLTPCEIISRINEMGGGVKFKCDDVKKIIAEDGSFE